MFDRTREPVHETRLRGDEEQGAGGEQGDRDQNLPERDFPVGNMCPAMACPRTALSVWPGTGRTW